VNSQFIFSQGARTS